MPARRRLSAGAPGGEAATSRAPLILTIGHSVRTAAEFTELLRAHGVARLVDVRTRPRSKRHPHFDAFPLGAALADAGIAYRQEPRLGGLRSARPDSRHQAIRDPGMRGFADHMETDGFAAALEELIGEACRGRCAIMCAEADPARCHRSFIADALVARGAEVVHVLDAGPPRPHVLRPEAVVEEGRLAYPGPPGLFDAGRDRG